MSLNRNVYDFSVNSIEKSDILNIYKYLITKNTIKYYKNNVLTFIEQVLIELLSFSSSVAHDRTKCLSLNDKPCMI